MSRERTPQWSTLDAANRERQYSPSSMLDGSIEPFIDAYRQRSAEAYTLADDVVTVSYGPKDSNTIDIARPTGNFDGGPVPLHVFIHGGYWQELGKADSFFLAPDCLANGHAFAAVDYTLAPHASIEEIVDECVDALSTLQDQGPELGLDPTAIVVSGSSAGAHLAAMATLRLPASQRPAGLILMSGIYQLEPLVGTYINDAVAMTVPEARHVSPLDHDVTGFPPAVVAFGDNETDEFKRQSRALVDRLKSTNHSVAEVEVAGRNHFDVVFDTISLLVPLLPTDR